MAYRTVYHTILTLDGSPASDRAVSFKLLPGSYTPDTTYIESHKTIRTDNTGYFEVDLWVNEEGDIPSQYLVTLPDGDKFLFVLESGIEPISLAVLRQATYTSDLPQYQTLLNYIQNHPELFVFDIIVEKSGQHIQSMSSTTWSVSHGLGKYPSVVAYDSNGNMIAGVPEYLDLNNLLFHINVPASGILYLN